jgi:hypothetical protein
MLIIFPMLSPPLLTVNSPLGSGPQFQAQELFDSRALSEHLATWMTASVGALPTMRQLTRMRAPFTPQNLALSERRVQIPS